MRTAAVFAVYLAALAFGTYQTFSPMFDSHFERTQTERCDGMLNHYILEHTWQVVANPDYRGSLFSPPFFFPEPYTLWYSEHLLGVAPAYWALRLAMPADLAYQWWQILMDALNFLAFAAVVRWLGGPHPLAVLGGYLWAFALVHIDQIKHQQMIPRFWVPLAVYHAWVFALAPATRPLNRMLACVFLQSIACVYTGWFLVMGLSVFLPVGLTLRANGWQAFRQFAQENRTEAVRIVGGWFAVLTVAFVPYLVVNWGVARSYKECEGLIPTPAAWLTGPPGTPWDETLGPRATEPDQPRPGFRPWVSDECWLFCGFGLYVVVLAATVHLFTFGRKHRPPELALAAAAIITALVWAMLAFTPYNGGPTLWHVVRVIPGGGAIRNVARVYVVVYMFATLGAFVWLAAVTAGIRPWLRTALLSLIAAFIMYEQSGYNPPSFAKTDFYAIADRTAEQLRATGADAGYVVPRYTDTQGKLVYWLNGEVMGMWVGLLANVPVVNGYSGRGPSGDHPSCSPATDEQLRTWLAGKFRGRLAIVEPDRPEATRVIVIE